MVDYRIRCLGYSPPLWDVATGEACAMAWDKLAPETRKNIQLYMAGRVNIDNAHQWLFWCDALGVDTKSILRKYFSNLPQKITEHVKSIYLKQFLQVAEHHVYDDERAVACGIHLLNGFFPNWMKHINTAEGPTNFLPILTNAADFPSALTWIVRRMGATESAPLVASELGFLARYDCNRTNHRVWEDLLCRWSQVRKSSVYSSP